MQFLPFLLIIVVFWFLLIRPQQKRQREAQQMQSALGVDSLVMLTSGIFGTVTEITDDHIGVEIAEGVTIKVVRAAIGRVLPEDFGEDVDADADGEDGDLGADTSTDGDALRAEPSTESSEETLAKYTPQPVQEPEKND